MNKEYKLITTVSGEMYVVKVVKTTDTEIVVENPLKVDYKYNTEQTPVFRYLPWQIVSDVNNPLVTINKNNILFEGSVHSELKDIYDRIRVQFVPLDDEEIDDEEDLDVVIKDQKVLESS